MSQDPLFSRSCCLRPPSSSSSSFSTNALTSRPVTKSGQWFLHRIRCPLLKQQLPVSPSVYILSLKEINSFFAWREFLNVFHPTNFFCPLTNLMRLSCNFCLFFFHSLFCASSHSHNALPHKKARCPRQWLGWAKWTLEASFSPVCVCVCET